MRYIINQGNAEITYISGGIFVSNGAWVHPKRILDDYELVVVLKGKFLMKIGEQTKVFQKGDSFILFPGEEHGGVEEAWNVSFYWLHFRFGGYEQIIKNERQMFSSLRKIPIQDFDGIVLNEWCHPKDLTQIVILINQLLYYQSLYKKTERSVRPCNIMMEMILYEISNTAIKINYEKLKTKLGGKDTSIDKIYDYIRANYYKNLQVTEIAEYFGYNSDYFIRMFRKESGMTPKQYVIHEQIRQAKILLATTSLKIREVAKQVGIVDERTFFRYFKKCEGISPGAYRRAFRKTHYNSR